MLHSLLQQKQIEYPLVRFLLKISAGHQVQTRIPARLLNRVLSNILNNAAEANKGVGEVYVKVRYAADGYQIEIEDQGPGIPPKMWPSLGMLGSTGKNHGRSQRGLGLHSAFEVIQQLGGQLRIAARNSHRGTTVRVNV